METRINTAPEESRRDAGQTGGNLSPEALIGRFRLTMHITEIGFHGGIWIGTALTVAHETTLSGALGKVAAGVALSAGIRLAHRYLMRGL